MDLDVIDNDEQEVLPEDSLVVLQQHVDHVEDSELHVFLQLCNSTLLFVLVSLILVVRFFILHAVVRRSPF